AAVDPVRQPAPPRRQQPAARLAGSAAGQHDADDAPAVRRQGRGQRPVRDLPRVVQQPRLHHGVVRRARALPHDGEGARRADRRDAGDAADRRHRHPAGDPRRHASGQRARGVEPTNARERQGRGLPVRELFPVRAAPGSDPRQRRRLRVRGDAGQPLVGRGAGGGVPRDGRKHQLPAAQGGRAMKKLNMQRRRFLKGAGGAVLALPFLESLAPRRAAGQTATPPKRFIALKTFSTQLVKEWYPAFTGNGYQLKNSKYSGSKADGTTLLTQKLVSGKNYTWAPLTDFQTSTGISGILGPALNPFLPKLTLIRGLDFLPAVNHNYGGMLGNFSSCTAATPCDADSLTDVPTIDQV